MKPIQILNALRSAAAVTRGRALGLASLVTIFTLCFSQTSHAEWQIRVGGRNFVDPWNVWTNDGLRGVNITTGPSATTSTGLNMVAEAGKTGLNAMRFYYSATSGSIQQG